MPQGLPITVSAFGNFSMESLQMSLERVHITKEARDARLSASLKYNQASPPDQFSTMKQAFQERMKKVKRLPLSSQVSHIESLADLVQEANPDVTDLVTEQTMIVLITCLSYASMEGYSVPAAFMKSVSAPLTGEWKEHFEVRGE